MHTTSMGSPRYRVHSDSTQSWFHFANQPLTGTEHRWRRARVDPADLPVAGNPDSRVHRAYRRTGPGTDISAKVCNASDSATIEQRSLLYRGPRTCSRTQVGGFHHLATIFLPDGVSGKGAVACTRQGGPSA
jgi:hypothetical protein